MKPRSRPIASATSSKDDTQPAALPISQQAIEQIAQRLNQLPTKEKESWSIREAIAYLSSAIASALTKGYSRKEIAAIIRTAGIPVSDTSLTYQLSQLSLDNQTKAANATQTRRLKAKISQQSPIVATGFALPFDRASRISAADSPHIPRDTVEDVISYLISDM